MKKVAGACVVFYSVRFSSSSIAGQWSELRRVDDFLGEQLSFSSYCGAEHDQSKAAHRRHQISVDVGEIKHPQLR